MEDYVIENFGIEALMNMGVEKQIKLWESQMRTCLGEDEINGKEITVEISSKPVLVTE